MLPTRTMSLPHDPYYPMNAPPPGNARAAPTRRGCCPRCGEPLHPEAVSARWFKLECYACGEHVRYPTAAELEFQAKAKQNMRDYMTRLAARKRHREGGED